jgi:transposase
MPKSCSSDLRGRVLVAVEEGATRREAAERFEVSPSSAVKWFQAWRPGQLSKAPALAHLQDQPEQSRLRYRLAGPGQRAAEASAPRVLC